MTRSAALRWSHTPLVLLAAVVLCAACAPTRRGDPADDDTAPPVTNPTPDKPGTLSISPNPIDLVVSQQEQAVRLTIRSSSYGDVSRTASLTLADSTLGFGAQGVLTIRGNLPRGGQTTLNASYGVQTGSAAVRVKVLAPDIIDPGVPADARTYFGQGGGPAPAFVYPFPRTMLPRNLPPIRLQWSGSATAKVYRLHIASPTFEQDLYFGPQRCSGVQCGVALADDTWANLLRSVAGGEATLTIAQSPGPGQPSGTSAPLALAVSPEDVKGGLYYWSTTITGIYRVPLGARQATVFINRGNEFNCSGCHAVSRDGKRVALEFGSANGTGGGVVDGADGKKYLVRPPAAGQWNLQTFNPSGDLLLVNWRQRGRVIRADTGQLVVDVPEKVGRFAQPEWSPDGQRIVLVAYPPEGNGDEWNATQIGDISVVPYNNGQFDTPQVIVPSRSNQQYHFYPSWTPDSRWIVYNTGTVPCGNGTCGTYNPVNTDLRLVQATPGATPILLQNATHQTGAATNWPRVAPFIQDRGRLIFFTFSAKFPVGFDKTGSNPQIWMAAVDLDKAQREPDKDPSYAPFWLPVQNPSENNHLGTWTTDVACNTKSDCPAEFDCVQNQCVPGLG